MPIMTDTYVVKINLNDQNLEKTIKDTCENQSARDPGPRRLVAAFAAGTNVILIFQVAPE